MTAARSDQLERRLARLRSGRDWSGYLAMDNAEAVAERLRSMIGDGQRYTWVAANALFGYRPEVRTGQVAEHVRLSSGEIDGHRYVYLNIPDTYGVWGLSTEAADEDAARRGRERDRVALEFRHRQLTIDHYAPAGYRLFWVIALEDEEVGR